MLASALSLTKTQQTWWLKCQPTGDFLLAVEMAQHSFPQSVQSKQFEMSNSYVEDLGEVC